MVPTKMPDSDDGYAQTHQEIRHCGLRIADCGLIVD